MLTKSSVLVRSIIPNTKNNNEALQLWRQLGSQSKTFKTDNQFKDLNIKIESNNDRTITIDLGLSTK